MTHVPSHGKALFLMLASSGMRISEALSLDKDDDLDFSKTPAEVKIRGPNSKTGDPRIAFISAEAKEAVEDWLRTRSEYLTVEIAKCKPRPHHKKEFRCKNPDDNTLFPFGKTTAYSIWNSALRKGYS